MGVFRVRHRRQARVCLSRHGLSVSDPRVLPNASNPPMGKCVKNLISSSASKFQNHTRVPRGVRTPVGGHVSWAEQTVDLERVPS
eukprot:1194646-Prorocentrum_minimum.AAC.5